MQAMAERDTLYKLSGDVQVGDAYLGVNAGGRKPKDLPGFDWLNTVWVI